MLSLNVIGAIQILSVLDAKCPINRMDGDKRATLSLKELKAKCTIDLTPFRIALVLLLQSKYIGKNSYYPIKYFLLKPLENISLYDLIKVFHSGLVIGDKNVLNTLYSGLNEEWSSLVYMDEQLSLSFSYQLRQIKLSHFKQMRNEESVSSILNALNPFFVYCLRAPEDDREG
ncbi:hypothetical protein [Bacteroides sp.]|uniref:hypothetical protein n=1 Tax=Bacteroides sp. TaxID=29523 RepID=UPI002FCBC641